MASQQIIVVNHYEPKLSPAANIVNNNIAMLETGVVCQYEHHHQQQQQWHKLHQQCTSKQWLAGHIVQNTDFCMEENRTMTMTQQWTTWEHHHVHYHQ